MMKMIIVGSPRHFLLILLETEGKIPRKAPKLFSEKAPNTPLRITLGRLNFGESH